MKDNTVYQKNQFRDIEILNIVCERYGKYIVRNV